MLKGRLVLFGGTVINCQNHLIPVLQCPQLVTSPLTDGPVPVTSLLSVRS